MYNFFHKLYRSQAKVLRCKEFDGKILCSPASLRELKGVALSLGRKGMQSPQPFSGKRQRGFIGNIDWNNLGNVSIMIA